MLVHDLRYELSYRTQAIITRNTTMTPPTMSVVLHSKPKSLNFTGRAVHPQIPAANVLLVFGHPHHEAVFDPLALPESSVCVIFHTSLRLQGECSETSHEKNVLKTDLCNPFCNSLSTQSCYVPLI